MKKIVNILGIKIEVTVELVNGNLFVASNNYGEPKNLVKGYKTLKAALNNEIAELTQMIGQEAY